MTEPIDSLPIFETPLRVCADTENRCFEIYDNINDRVASDIEDIEQAKIFAAAPEMYDFISQFVTILGQQLLARLGADGKDIYEEAVRILRKARGESEAEE